MKTLLSENKLNLCTQGQRTVPVTLSMVLVTGTTLPLGTCRGTLEREVHTLNTLVSLLITPKELQKVIILLQEEDCIHSNSDLILQ